MLHSVVLSAIVVCMRQQVLTYFRPKLPHIMSNSQPTVTIYWHNQYFSHIV